jgi:recombinational DNA repair ATPase RecF
MLAIRSLEIEGFGPYYERAVLEFAPEGVTVVYGDNMVGKTSLMNAIRFAFFGEIHGRGHHTRSLLYTSDRTYGLIDLLRDRFDDHRHVGRGTLFENLREGTTVGVDDSNVIEPPRLVRPLGLDHRLRKLQGGA